ncbi:MAG: diguanylate cyclase [Deltaproteobacteria bacterium]|nr:diguanylate cyclase [Deltaproteobacteria bacterium]
MSPATIKKAVIFLVPLAILAAAFFFLRKIAALNPAYTELLLIAPYLAAVTGMFLSVHFHRGRPFTALLLVALFYYAYRTFLVDGITGYADQGIYFSFALLLPFNFALLAVMSERGIFSVAGRLRFIFLLVQAFLAWFAFRHYAEDILPLLTRIFFPLAALDGLPLPQPLLLFAGLLLILIFILAALRQAPIESGLLGGLGALVITLAAISRPDIPATFCTAAGLIITLSILQDSYNMAFRDDLTGIPSRRALNESLHGIGRRYAVAMLDIDHFKQFNDTYGHDVGDQVLKMVARKILAVSGGGRAYRYGGEEFTVIFSGKSSAEAVPHLEALRQVIAEYRLVLRGDDRPKDARQGESKRGSRSDSTEVSVTISIGVAEAGDAQRSVAEVMKAADKALYKAKSKGRNQVCC